MTTASLLSPTSDDSPPRPPPERRTGRRDPEKLVFLGLAVVVVVVVFANNWGQFNSDTRADLYLHPGTLLANSLTSWVPSPIQTGTPNFNTGLAPIAALIWTIEAVGIPPWATVRLWRSALILLAGWGAVRLLREVGRGRTTSAGRVGAAVAYVGNCFLIIGAASTPILLPFALLPWLVITFARTVDSPQTWKWPAGFALIFFAMTGMQAGVVPLYLLAFLPAYLIYARLSDRRRWRDLLVALVKCGALTLLVSLYWLIPSFLASKSGAAVATESEDPKLIALTTSYGESLRLLGQWPLYGRFAGRLFVPKGINYLANPFVVIATFCLPFLAALGAFVSRARARLLGVLLLAIAVPLMVGMFPPDHPSGYGRLLDLFFKHVPGAIAFRTTYKIAPVALLGFALLIGLGVSAVSPRLAGRHRWLAIGLCSLGAVVVVATTLPAWTGNLFPTPLKIPDYWTQAGTDLNAGPTDSRLLIVPGSDGAEYRWAGKSPDDIFNLVLTTPTVSRLTVSAGAIYPANFLAALDVALNTNRAKGSTTSTMSRYLGAGNVLERNDMTWEDIAAGRPSDIHAQLVADPGLALQQVFGAPGENTTRTDGSDPKPDASARDALLPPLQLFGVKQPVATARAESAEQAVVIDGDNFALPTLTQLGMMADNPSYLLAGNMTSADLATAIASGDRLVITDTNRRRLASVHAVDDSYSVTLDPSGPVTGQTATSTTLWPLRPETQTVAELADVSSITATRAGAEFTLAPTGQPTAAFDGDPQSVWVASTFGNAAGQGIKVALEHPTPVRKVAVDVYPTDPAAVTSLLVRAGGWTNLVPVPSDGHVEVQIPDVVGDVSDLNVSIAGVRGRGTVGISEITIDGVKPVLYARMPTTISDLARSLSPEESQQLAAAPLDLVMSRQVGPPGLPTQDEERVLNRQFDLPGDRTFTLAGQLSADEPLNQAALWADSAGVATGSCVPIGTLDGQPFDVRFDASPSATQPGVLLSFTQCGASIDLTAGTHRLTTNPGFPVATMRFSSGTPSLPTATAPALTVLSRSNTDLHARTEGGTGAFFLVTGHAYDPRWVATVDGKPLGTPTVVDGYSTGWRIDEAGNHDIRVRFFPQRSMNAGLAASAVGVLLCAFLYFRPKRWTLTRWRLW